MSGIDNLKPVKTKEEARTRGRNGGIASGKAKKEKKLMSEIYAEALAEEYDIQIDEKTRKKLQGKKLYNYVFGKLLSRGDSATVSLLKEIREATEGQKHILANDPENPLLMDEAARAVLAKHGI